MKHTRLALVLAATSLTTLPAFAASTTMVQFGSFETRAEAEKRLNEVNGKHGALISKLTASVREVKLPPDNLTVYRTQAGPLPDRAAAQSICTQLASAGDECYIVQTAMVAPAAALVDATPTLSAPAASVTATPVAAALAGVSAGINKEVATQAPDLTNKLSVLQETPAPAVTLAASSEPSPEMKAALDKAVTTQQAAEQSDLDILAAAEARKQSKRSIWSRMNPFSSDEPKSVKTLAPEVDPKAVPVESVQSQPLEVLRPVESASIEPIVTTVAPVVIQQPVATPAPAVANVPFTMDSRPVITQAEPMRLPPPPAPLKASDRELLASGKPITPPSAPVTTGTIASTAGTVRVEEAKRVPVTSSTLTSVQTGGNANAVPVVAPFQQPAVTLQPSATEGRKTVWAQVGPFEDSNEALAFWSDYRQNHPDFPVVRVRVTSPYQKQQRGLNESWLRIGPVSQVAFVKNLCANLVPPQDPEKLKETGQKLKRCGVVTDMGISSPLARTPGFLPASRYSR